MAGLMIFSLVGASGPALAQPGRGRLPSPPAAPSPSPGSQEIEPAPSPGRGNLLQLNFRDSPLDQVLAFYGELTGRTMIKAPGINATINLRSQTMLTREEALEALESVLAMNNVALVPMGTKFFKVVQPSAVRQEGMTITTQMPETGFEDNDTLVSQVINLKYVEIADVQPIIQGMLHGYGKIQPLERTNSILVTDTASNLRVIMEVLEMLDQPVEAKMEIRVYELQYAEAGKIASRLQELVADAQQEEKPRVETPSAAPQTPPGVIRPRGPGSAVANQASEADAALAERGIVQGKVKIIADERTNILIVISRPSNFVLFDKIVAVLDRPVEPEVVVRVVALEYADAEEIAGILNNFVGAAKADSTAPKAAEGSTPESPRAKALEDFVRQRASERPTAGAEGAAKIGQLSENTRILADKRTNSLLLMGTRGDIVALEEVIDQLDVMLAQVLIEAVILEVKLSKGVSYGVDWLQRSMTMYNDRNVNGVRVRDPLMSYGGGWSSASRQFVDAGTIDRSTTISQGMTYFLTLFDLNIDAVIQMVANSSDARVLSTPVILTTDNTEAMINSSEQRPVVTQTATTDAGSLRSSYEYRDIGVQLKVKPRINPNRFVVLDVTQTADTPGDDVLIDGNSVPSIFKRELTATIAVPSRSTIVLGGLVSTDKKNTRTKVPILGDIPLLGALFRSDANTDTRTELLVLITPYVLMTPEEARRETERLHRESVTSGENWERGWSDSPLADMTPAQRKDDERAEREQRRRREEAQKRQRAADEAVTIEPEPVALEPDEPVEAVEIEETESPVEQATEVEPMAQDTDPWAPVPLDQPD